MRIIRFLLLVLVCVVTAALVVPKVVETGDNRHSGWNKAKSEISTFKGPLDRFQLDCDRYPTT